MQGFDLKLQQSFDFKNIKKIFIFSYFYFKIIKVVSQRAVVTGFHSEPTFRLLEGDKALLPTLTIWLLQQTFGFTTDPNM